MVKKEKPKKEKQLDLGLKQSPKNILYKIRSKISDILIRFEIKEFLRNPFTWFVIILSLCLIGVQIYILLNNISSYPNEIPIWQNQTSLEKRLENKEFLYFFPSLSGFIIIFGSVLTNIFYHKEKFLSKMMLLSIILSIIGLTIAFLKLVSSI